MPRKTPARRKPTKVRRTRKASPARRRIATARRCRTCHRRLGLRRNPSARESGGALLFRGQRVARKHHHCDDCDRPIERGESYWATVRLIVDPKAGREVQAQKSCCRRPRGA